MTWKKTWFSYLLWGLSSVLICVAFVYAGTICLKQFDLPLYWIAVLVAAFLLCYLILKLCKKKMSSIQLSKSYLITFESLVFVGLLAGGLLARLYAIVDISSLDLYKIVSISEGAENFETTHGAFGVFVILFRTLFYYIGNSWFGAVILQISLQLFSFVLFYFVVRRVAGAIASLVSFGFLMFSPECLRISTGLDPAAFYFLLCILGIYFLTESNQVIFENQKVKIFQYFSALFIGLLFGVMVYLDLVGIFVFVFGLTFLGLKNKEQLPIKIPYLPLYYILLTVGMLLGLISLLVLEGSLDNLTILETFLNWEWNYRPVLGQSLYPVIGFDLILLGWIYVGTLMLTLLLGVLGFWESKWFNPQFGFGLLVALLLVLQYHCPAAQEMNRMYFLTIAVAGFAGSGIQALFTKDFEFVELESELEFETNGDVDVLEEKKDQLIVEEEQPKKEINYIPNPLPLPKKHVKKSMGYGIEVKTEQMCFDIDISEEDDFDI